MSADKDGPEFRLCAMSDGLYRLEVDDQHVVTGTMAECQKWIDIIEKARREEPDNE